MTIISVTDLQGNITYANPYFIKISGYAEHELIGASQNILRHPDMPIEAFADLWLTIKSGMSWSGIVKNRCKNGDFYWVSANITPVIENGRAVGYMSVRTKPTPEQVAQAADLYSNFKDGNARALSLHHGKVVKSGFSPSLLTLRDWPLSRQIGVNALLFILTILAFVVTIWILDGIGTAPRNWLSGMAGLSILLAMYSWLTLHGAIVTPLQQALAVVDRIAGGDLSAVIESTSDNDMGKLLTKLRQININLCGIIGDMRNNFLEIMLSTEEIAKGNIDLSARTESQASHLEETAASMEELTLVVKQNAAHIDSATLRADKASHIAEQGGEIVGNVAITMERISDSSVKISEIIRLIDGIAFQTNILALNAAVEAARAGENGRGFAVVASEVRTLAQRSATAAKEINCLIDLSIDNISAGTALSGDAGTNMREIIESVRRVMKMMKDISASIHEQNNGIMQANQALIQMDDISQQNATLAEQTTTSVINLKQQTIHMRDALAIFKIGEIGRKK